MNVLNKYKFLILGILTILFLLGGAYYFFSANKSSKPSEVIPEPTKEIIPTIIPKDLGLTLMARSDKRAIKFEITNIKDITSLDYEISYVTKGNIPRGAIGHIEVKPTDKKIETNYIELGTCSSGKCKYDEGVSKVFLIIKIIKADGKVYQAEQSLELYI